MPVVVESGCRTDLHVCGFVARAPKEHRLSYMALSMSTLDLPEQRSFTRGVLLAVRLLS